MVGSAQRDPRQYPHAERAVLARFPKLSPAAERPDWGSNFAIRGLNSLAVHLHG
jgi:hypothetical protein